MKLYCLRTYDDLLGLREIFVIASSKEDAMQKDERYKFDVLRGIGHYIHEIDGNKLLRVLGVSDYEKYDLQFTIKEKEDVSEKV